MAVFVLPSAGNTYQMASSSALRGSATGKPLPSLGSCGSLGLGLMGGSLALVASGKRAVHRSAFDASKQIGATAPLGFFDPLGFSSTEASFNSMRSAEIKHGRVAMMASVGMVFQHYVTFPQLGASPSGVAAIYDEKVLPFTAFLFVLSGALELSFWKEDKSQPGNMGDPMSLASGAMIGDYTEEWRNREINNGRMAMFAVLGQIVAELVTGKDAVEQLKSITSWAL